MFPQKDHFSEIQVVYDGWMNIWADRQTTFYRDARMQRERERERERDRQTDRQTDRETERERQRKRQRERRRALERGTEET